MSLATLVRARARALSIPALSALRARGKRRRLHEQVWRLHRDGDYFLKQGGRSLLPPANLLLPLTNTCNLKCTICGTQNDAGLVRASLDIETFRKLAAVLFPFRIEVELNNYGEPLLYPHIDEVLETIRAHGCRIRLQTNGTHLTPSVTEQLCALTGELSVSIDATGALFEQQRRGARWKDVEARVRALSRVRDPAKLRVTLYPTITRNTLPDVINLLDWSRDAGIDEVHLHRYEIIFGSAEERPTAKDMAALRDRILEWVCDHADAPSIKFDFVEWLHRNVERLQCFEDLKHWDHIYKCLNIPQPRDAHSRHEKYICAAPVQMISVGLDGDIYLCGRSYKVSLGRIESSEDFAEVWFGKRYGEVRNSLLRGCKGPRATPECEACVRLYAPDEC